MIKPELCEQHSAGEIQYMTGGKIIDMFHKRISALCEMYSPFKLNVLLNAEFDSYMPTCTYKGS